MLSSIRLGQYFPAPYELVEEEMNSTKKDNSTGILISGRSYGEHCHHKMTPFRTFLVEYIKYIYESDAFYVEIRNQEIKKDHTAYERRDAGEWHTDMFNIGFYNELLTICFGEAPTEFAIGENNCRREKNHNTHIVTQDISKCIKEQSMIVESYSNIFVYMNENTIHRASRAKQDGHRLFIRIYIETSHVNY